MHRECSSVHVLGILWMHRVTCSFNPGVEELQPFTGSLYNSVEAAAVAREVRRLQEQYTQQSEPLDIVVMTPYRAQLTLLSELMPEMAEQYVRFWNFRRKHVFCYCD